VNAVEYIVKRERVVVGAALALLTLLAWIYVWRGAGMGMSALQMTRVALFPHLLGDGMPGMTMPPIAWTAVVLMWWVMMIAMMTPSAAPLVLLYGRVMRHARTQGQSSTRFGEFFLVLGYLLSWLAFSVIASAIQLTLEQSGLISTMMLWSQSKLLSAAVLGVAGAYQFSPLKRVCLKHCRGPVEFLSRHMRQGMNGALAMGFRHGIWCVGCCWTLMSLLFVGGVMNLIWIALLAVLVLIEKIAPNGILAGRVVGVILLAWGAATLAV
jgi:predicted metal-binding membrane protein